MQRETPTVSHWPVSTNHPPLSVYSVRTGRPGGSRRRASRSDRVPSAGRHDFSHRPLADDVRRRLLEIVLQADASFLGADDYGQRYAIDFVVQGVSGPVTVRSLWIIRHGEDFPRFASCYVL